MNEFKFTEKQKTALNIVSSPAEYIMLYGGRRSGKSFANIYAICVRALKAPGSWHAIFRKQRVHLEKNLIRQTFWTVLSLRFPELFAWFRVPMASHFDKKHLIATFPNGSMIYFGGLDDKERAEQLLGSEYSTIFLNEASEVGYQVFLKLDSCLAQKNILRNKFLMDLNPVKTRGRPHWTKDVFINKHDPLDNCNLKDPQNYNYLLMNPHDNIDNLDPSYIQRLERMPKDQRDRFLYGLYVEDDSGGVYSQELNDSRREGRINGNIEINVNYPLYAVYDPGEYTAAWLVQFGEGFILVHDYIENQSKPLRWYINFVRSRGYVIDTMFLPADAKDYKAEVGASLYSLAAAEAQNPLVPKSLRFKVQALKKQSSVEIGINAVRSMFDNLHFNKVRCQKGLEHLANYRYQDSADPDGMFVEKIKAGCDCNHAADALRYVALAARYIREDDTQRRLQREPGKIYTRDLFGSALDSHDNSSPFPGGVR
jgi:PBSX family phage terminase large subunit